MDYQDFIRSKTQRHKPSGFEVALDDLNPESFGEKHQYQPHVIQWAARLGKAAIFQNYGLGKSLEQLKWGELVAKHTEERVLFLAPWAVAHQTVNEGKRFGVDVNYYKSESDSKGAPLVITNYDRLKDFNPDNYTAVVLDESGILKQFRGKTKQYLCDSFKGMPYKLCCSATPAPNDWLELQSHAEFLEVLENPRFMISKWFQNDTMQAGKYKLKPYAQDDFWQWVSSWAVCMTKPSDLGFSDEGWQMPPLNYHYHTIAVDHALTQDEPDRNGQLSLIRSPKLNATSIHKEAKLNTPLSAEKIADLVSEYPDQTWVIWCFTDYESAALKKAIPQAVELKGSENANIKEQKLKGFSNGEIQILITKPEIAGLGLNWQHCHHQAFMMGTSYSFEQFHQALHRLYRFGQEYAVETHLVFPETAASVRETIQRKQRQHELMQSALRKAVTASQLAIHQKLCSDDYNPTITMEIPQWLTSKTA